MFHDLLAEAARYRFLTGWMIFLKAAKIESRFGTGISWPLKVLCFGAGPDAPPSPSQSVCDGSCVSPVIPGEVSGCIRYGVFA